MKPNTDKEKASAPETRKGSPLPWTAEQSTYADMPDVPCSDWTVAAPNEQLSVCFTRNEANAKLIVASVNNADKLAAALRELSALAFSDADDDTLEASLVKAKAALAAYESEVGK